MSLVVRASVALAFAFVALAPVAAVGPPAPISPARVAGLMKKLDADAFRTRQNADKALRALGRPVLPFVRAELATTTSFEVRHRLRLIEQHLSPDENFAELAMLLGHSDKKWHQHAGQTLRNAGPAALPALRRELRPDLPAAHRKRVQRVIDELEAMTQR